MSLNGWQRLWALVGIIYLIPIILIFIDVCPTESKLYDKWYSELYFFAKDNNHLTYQNITPEEFHQLNSDKANTLLKINDQLLPFGVIKIGGFEIPDNEITIIKMKYMNELEDLLAAKSKTFFNIFILCWFFPLLIMYVLGRAIGWVYKGFRS